MTVVRPLPGIRFEAQARPLRDVLPRMDIPLFAGFAASGPLHVPVAIEDAAELSMIFGSDVELPRPAQSREPRFAHLAPAVRAFFRNGGRRCWVVRVADRKTAATNEFAIPGLVDAVTRKPALAIARSQGSWSDALRVQTNLVGAPLPFEWYDGTRLRVGIASARDVVVGDLLRVTWSHAALYLFVGAVAIDGRSAIAEGTQQWSGNLASPLQGTPAVERLTFDLTVHAEGDTPLRMKGLGFAPAHPRYFGALPDDVTLYTSDTLTELARDARTPRFPLAARPATALLLPETMSALFSEKVGPRPANGLELERDGLAQFSAALFVDPHLADTKTRDLLDHANALRYEGGLSLTGIHAGLAIEEATLLSVPDAVHRGWMPDAGGALASPPGSSPPASPLASSEACDETHGAFVDCSALDPIDAPFLVASAPDGGKYTLTWNPLPDALDELQEATRDDFSDAATIAITGSGNFDFVARASGDYFYRVRRLRDGRTSAWSNGVAVRVGGVSGFVAFDDDDTGDPHLVDVHRAMLRMCAARADMTALLSLPRHYDERRAITHTTTLSAGVESQALSYGALWHPWLIGRDDVGQPSGRAARAEAGATFPLRANPPDGATAGVIASRAITRGAWVAPANEPLVGVVALTPEIPATARQALQDAAVNLIRREPAGFLCLDADTLSTDEDVRALNVRRLLILVRRAAIRTGNDYAFEPHSITLRNTIKRGFESMLASMYHRGAFAGRTAKSAYQVVTDETVNTPRSTDQGRFIAELRIAPSRPLAFLTVRLVQRGEAATAEEVL